MGFASLSRPFEITVEGQTAPPSTSNGPNCTGCAAQSDQALYIPLTYLPEEQNGQIVFNSRSMHVMDVTPVFYATDGTAIAGEPVSINPSNPGTSREHAARERAENA